MPGSLAKFSPGLGSEVINVGPIGTEACYSYTIATFTEYAALEEQGYILNRLYRTSSSYDALT